MIEKFSRFLDRASEYFAPRKGLLPIIGMGLIVINFLLQFLGANWFSQTDFFLHLGVLIAILGFMMAWAL